MDPEQLARQTIDRMLHAAGWAIQNMDDFDLSVSQGVALREFRLKAGYADYMLFVDGMAVGVVEAKKEGTTLSGVDTQSQKYLDGLPDYVPRIQIPLPFAYESTGIETVFRDPDYRSRRVFSFHQPQTLLAWAQEKDTLRARLRCLPELTTVGLRACQTQAITGVEQSFAENRPRSLIQMATGSGKTFLAISFIYRLIKFAEANRVLFLVDRGNLGKQTMKEFQQYVTPDDGRKFTELYNVQHLQGQTIDAVSKVTISTIQRLYSMLRGEELEEELDEKSLHELSEQNERTKEVVYNPDIPIETFDFIVVDECHRSIYNTWRQVLEYFDATLIGLTATPSKQTLGFFNQNLVMEYNHERAVADGVNVGYDVYRLKTRLGEEGGKVEAGYSVDFRDKASREIRWQQLDETLEYEEKDLDRSVVAPSQIRTIIRAYREKLFTELFPNRNEVPKTLIFAKNDSHAEDIVEIVREEFGKGNEFCKKITYKAQEKTDDLISSFRNSYNPRIAVTVDMISTGTDVKPLEVLIFMRDVKSQVYFEQMIGRGTRIIDQTDLLAVTPDAKRKTHFVLIDAVGVTESNKSTDVRPLERKRSVGFGKLMDMVAFGKRDNATLQSLASRLARLDRELDAEDRDSIKQTTQGKDLSDLSHALLDAVDPDKQRAYAQETFNTNQPSEEQLKDAAKTLTSEATKPFNNATLRNTLSDLKTRSEQIIDKVSQDEVTYAGYDFDKAQKMVTNFQQFIEENKDELLALQILYNQPYGQRHLTYSAIKQLAQALRKPPYYLDVDRLWTAYEQLEKAKVKNAPTEKVLTNIISLVRYAIGKSELLESYPEQVDQRFSAWLAQQQQQKDFTPEQIEWLMMIKDHITTSLAVEPDDFNDVPFSQRGGRLKAHKLFGTELPMIIKELNEVLGA